MVVLIEGSICNLKNDTEKQLLEKDETLANIQKAFHKVYKPKTTVQNKQFQWE